MESKEKAPKKGMVDVSKKNITKRLAVASARIQMNDKAFKALIAKESPKGDVLESARVAGVMAAKRTSSVIPYCHPLDITHVNVRFKGNEEKRSISVRVEVGCLDRTGVEVEALTAASVAALTIYDMMKWADKSMVISDVMLLEKSGGKTGNFKRFK